MEDTEYTLLGECERYGLPVNFSLLMRHIYASQALVQEINKKTILCLLETIEASSLSGFPPSWVKPMKEELQK